MRVEALSWGRKQAAEGKIRKKFVELALLLPSHCPGRMTYIPY